MKRVSLLQPGELSSYCPNLAWPTVVLFLSAASIWTASAYAAYTGLLPLLITFPIQTCMAFALFTPAHDAAHSAIGKGNMKWINEVIGRFYGLLNAAPFCAFRWIHLQHHKHTNNEGDPDLWSKGYNLPRVFLPFFWLTQDFHYYYHYIKSISSRPVKEVWEALLTLIGMWYLIYRLSKIDSFHLWMCWLLPNRIATASLAWLFDYVPHRPHHKQDIYKQTAKVDGFLAHNDMTLDYLILYQNFHNIHHLYPTIPFYNYQKVWYKYSKELKKLGTEISTIIDSK